MTLQQLIAKASAADTRILLAVFLAPILLALILRLLHGRGRGGLAPWKYAYSVLVYLVCVPGMCSCVLIAYGVFFMRQNLLNVSFVVYYLPPAVMIGTLVLIRRSVRWDQLPGVDRLRALMLMIGVSMGIALAIMKTRIWLVFGGSFKWVIGIALFCFILMKMASGKLLSGTETEDAYTDSGDGGGGLFGGRTGGSKSRSDARSAAKELERMKKRMGSKT